MKFLLPFLLAPLLLAACSAPPPPANVSSTAAVVSAPANATLIALAQDYLRQHHPDWLSASSLLPVVSDHGTYWEVSYPLPPNTLGGGPVVQIQKSPLVVLRAYHGQ